MKKLENAGNRGQKCHSRIGREKTGTEPAERSGSMKTDQYLSRTHWGTLLLSVFNDIV